MQKHVGIILFIITLFMMSGCITKNQCKSRISYKDIHINRHLNIDSLLKTPDSLELSTILNKWRNNGYTNDSSNLVKTFVYRNQKGLKVVEHFYQGQKHYGAIIQPKNYTPNKKYPLLLWANGLDQRDPSISVNRHFILDKLALELEDHFLLVPSFRGQALRVGSDCYCSDGFFGDAFDGATDDALYLLSLAESMYSSIDGHKVSVFGVSRGATVALLAGIRRPDIDYIIAQSGPYNFLEKETYRRHNMQYKYQFLSHPDSPSEIRNHVISSSPSLFLREIQGDILLIHGRSDDICPVENAENIISYFGNNPQLESQIVNEGHVINKIRYVCKKILERHQ